MLYNFDLSTGRVWLYNDSLSNGDLIKFFHRLNLCSTIETSAEGTFTTSDNVTFPTLEEAAKHVCEGLIVYARDLGCPEGSFMRDKCIEQICSPNEQKKFVKKLLKAAEKMNLNQIGKLVIFYTAHGGIHIEQM